MLNETHIRTTAKTVAYRILSILSGMLATILVGGTGAMAGQVALVMLIAGTIMYYLHDRVWLLFTWGLSDNAFETPKRSIAKMVVYRLMVIVAMIITARLIITDDNTVAASWALMSMAMQLIIYYALERIFNKMNWGKQEVLAPSKNI